MDSIEQHIYSQHLIARSIIGEVASSLAEVGCELGYLSVEREYHSAEIKKMLNRSFFKKNWSETELTSLVGPPSYAVNAGGITTYCYGASDELWHYFDFVRIDSTNMRLLDQPVLRNVRFPGNRTRLL